MYKYLSLLVLLTVAAVVLAEKQDLETAEQFYRSYGYYPDYYYSLVRGAGFPGYPGYSAAAYPAAPYPAAAYPSAAYPAAAYPAYANYANYAGYPAGYQYAASYGYQSGYPYSSYGYNKY